MEPPSHTQAELKSRMESKSDDPLSECVFMIVGDISPEYMERHYVCAYSAHTGLSYYVGVVDSLIS